MTKNKICMLLILNLILQNSCEKNNISESKVMINELMSINTTIVADQDGEFNDWLELFNLTATSINLSGYYLSDSRKNLTKWQIPSGTTISGYGYLIFWADRDSAQLGLHTNFKLSSLGEELFLSDPDLNIMDEVIYPSQTLELSWSRLPNGTGSFLWQTPTFHNSNDVSK